MWHTHMKVVDDLLHRLTLAPRRGRQREHAKVRIATHEVAHDAAVGVVATGAMRLVDDEAGDESRVEPALGEVVLDRLRR